MMFPYKMNIYKNNYFFLCGLILQADNESHLV